MGYGLVLHFTNWKSRIVWSTNMLIFWGTGHNGWLYSNWKRVLPKWWSYKNFSNEASQKLTLKIKISQTPSLPDTKCHFSTFLTEMKIICRLRCGQIVGVEVGFDFYERGSWVALCVHLLTQYGRYTSRSGGLPHLLYRQVRTDEKKNFHINSLKICKEIKSSFQLKRFGSRKILW